MKWMRESLGSKQLGPPPPPPNLPLPSAAKKSYSLCFFWANRDNVFLQIAILHNLIFLGRFSVIKPIRAARELRKWGVSQCVAKVINAKSSLANFPADTHEEENSLHDGCNKEHDPT